MSRVVSSLSESMMRISSGPSWTRRLSSKAEMFRASFRTVVTTLMSNTARNRVPVMMVSTCALPETPLLSDLDYSRVPPHGPHRDDHRHPTGNHQDGPGGQGAGRPAA